MDAMTGAWSHIKIHLKKIERLSEIAIVNYDCGSRGRLIENQINEAKVFFSEFEEVLTDFLVKPSNEGDYIDVDEYIQNLDEVSKFDILGFTEKELGNSIITRLNNVYRIRTALIKRNYNNPIHIFGCIDPSSAWLFFILGADIFDGLSWLRYRFTVSGESVYINSHNIHENISNTDSENYSITLHENLNRIESVVEEMIEFTATESMQHTTLSEQFRKSYQEIVSTVIGGI